MQAEHETQRQLLTKDLMDLLIRVGLIGLVVYLSFKVFSPFLALMLWALILAVALYPLHQRLRKRLGFSSGRTSTLMVVTLLIAIGVPTVMLGVSFAEHIHDQFLAFENNEIKVSKPDPGVADWPVIGPQLHQAWNHAATNLPAFLEDIKPALEKLSQKVMAAATSTASALFLFLGALIVAGIMMAYGESGSATMQRVFCRLSGTERGAQVHKLATATVRSVAVGVVGIAFIQALLLGIGFIIADIPAAGVLAVVTLFIGILQLPALLLTIPVIIYMWSFGDASTPANVLYTAYLIVAGAADGFLKPMLLGRGVDAPMPVILLGALGGMMTTGLIGLFIGAVILAVAYRLFMTWVDEYETPPEEALTEAQDGTSIE